MSSPVTPIVVAIANPATRYSVRYSVASGIFSSKASFSETSISDRIFFQATVTDSTYSQFQSYVSMVVEDVAYLGSITYYMVKASMKGFALFSIPFWIVMIGALSLMH